MELIRPLVPNDLDRQLELAALLEDPVRRKLYQLIASSYPDALSRDQAARGAGLSRRLAAFHLDKLVEAGLLEPSFRRLSGRTGPGAGRPSKLYRRSEQEIRLHLPVRQYELAATLLVSAINGRSGETPIDALKDTAREFGLRLGKSVRSETGEGARQDQLIKVTRRILAEYGYEPAADRGDVIRFRNCPFEILTQRRSSPVCDMNWAMLDGFLKGLGASRVKAISRRDEPGCCVILRLRPAA